MAISSGVRGLTDLELMAHLYRRAGFVPFKRAVETFPDPRLSGILPAGCAPQIPLVGASTVSRPDS